MRGADFDFGVTGLATSFHQDWPLEGPPGVVLDMTLHAAQDPSSVSALLRDALMIRAGLAENDFELLWSAAIDGYPRFLADVGSGRTWLDLIVERCGNWFAAHHGESFEAADPEPGWNHREVVQAEIEDLRRFPVGPGLTAGLASAVADALLRCSSLCSPELAFRFLLKIITTSLVPLSPERFERLSRIGASLAHGEYVVSAVEFLVDDETGV